MHSRFFLAVMLPSLAFALYFCPACQTRCPWASMAPMHIHSSTRTTDPLPTDLRAPLLALLATMAAENATGGKGPPANVDGILAENAYIIERLNSLRQGVWNRQMLHLGARSSSL